MPDHQPVQDETRPCSHKYDDTDMMVLLTSRETRHRIRKARYLRDRYLSNHAPPSYPCIGAIINNLIECVSAQGESSTPVRYIPTSMYSTAPRIDLALCRTGDQL